MALVRPISDLFSLPSSWASAPHFSKVNSTTPDDTTFVEAPVISAPDPQIALGLGDLEIPYGSSGRIEVQVRMRWSAALTVAPVTVRIGLADTVDLTGDNPTLLFERSRAGSDIFDITTETQLEFKTFEVAFDYADFAGNGAAFGIYVEMTPDVADTTQKGQIAWVEVLSCVPAVLVDTCSLGSLTAGDIINRARDHHFSFDTRKHPNGALLRLLSSYQRDITAKVARVNPAVCASNITVTLPLADFDAGVTLPSFTYVLPDVTLRVISSQLSEPIDLKNVVFRLADETPVRFAYLQGNILFLGRRAENYTPYDQLLVQLVLTPKNLVALSDPLVLPDYGVDTYVGRLIGVMARRSDMGGELLRESLVMERDFLTSVAQQKGAEVSSTIDVFP